MVALLNFLIAIIIVGLICWVLWWLIDFIGLPEPFNKVAKVVIALVAVVFLVGSLTGHIPTSPLLKVTDERTNAPAVAALATGSPYEPACV